MTASARRCLRDATRLPQYPPRPGGAFLLSIRHNVCFSIQLSELLADKCNRATVSIVSSEIAKAELRISTPLWTHLYALPALCFYPLLAYAYYVKYDEWLKSEEWTFLACVTLGAGHGLSFLVTRWSAGARAWITTRKVCVSILS